MHEMSLAEGILDIVADTARAQGATRVREITLEIGVDGSGHIIEAGFTGSGCAISQASASYLMDEVNGKTLAEVLAIDHETLMDNLGKEIVQQRTRNGQTTQFAAGKLVGGPVSQVKQVAGFQGIVDGGKQRQRQPHHERDQHQQHEARPR